MHLNIVPAQRANQAEVHARETLMVNTCGQAVQIDRPGGSALLEMQKALQARMQMEGQAFSFYDVNGTELLTDGDVHNAVAKGQTPISATLTDGAIHAMENRREELAQMQWKLMRDQIAVMNAKIGTISKLTTETQSQVDVFKQDSKALIEKVHKDALDAIQCAREVTISEWRQLSERVNAAAQLVNHERQKRDTMFQGTEKQMSSLRDMFDAERNTRQQEFARQMSYMQDIKSRIDSEKKEFEDLKDKHVFDMHTLVERSEQYQGHVNTMFQEQQMEATRVAEGFQNILSGNTRLVNDVRAGLEQIAQETKVRIDRLEEKYVSLETRVTDVTSRHVATVDRLAERHEKVSQVVESLKFEERQNQTQVQMALSKVKSLETSLEETEAMAREHARQERQGRDEEVRRTHLAFLSEHQKQISLLEEKFVDRLERESYERERHVQTLMEEVGNASPNVVRSISMPTEKAKVKKFQPIADGGTSPLSPSASEKTLTLASLESGGRSTVASASQEMPRFALSPSRLREVKTTLARAETSLATSASSPTLKSRPGPFHTTAFSVPMPARATVGPATVALTPVRSTQMLGQVRGSSVTVPMSNVGMPGPARGSSVNAPSRGASVTATPAPPSTMTITPSQTPASNNRILTPPRFRVEDADAVEPENSPSKCSFRDFPDSRHESR